MAATHHHHEIPTSLAITVADGCARVRIGGDVDLLGTHELAEALDVLIAQRVQRIEVRLDDAARLDSAAVELLATTHGRLVRNAGRLAVTGAGHQAEDLLRRRGLQGLLRAG